MCSREAWPEWMSILLTFCLKTWVFHRSISANVTKCQWGQLSDPKLSLLWCIMRRSDWANNCLPQLINLYACAVAANSELNWYYAKCCYACVHEHARSTLRQAYTGVIMRPSDLVYWSPAVSLQRVLGGVRHHIKHNIMAYQPGPSARWP